MKKFFTLIIFACAFIPAIQGMNTNLPADVQKKYDNLVVLIKNADVEAFKPAFDMANLPTENITGLEQSVAETKVVVAKGLEELGDNNRSRSKIVKGGLETLVGSIAGVSFFYHMICFIRNKVTIQFINGETVRQEDFPNSLRKFAVATGSFFIFGGFLQDGVKKLIIGLNYKQYLQNQLTNLDAIASHIAHAKEQAN